MKKFLFEGFFWLFFGRVCPKCGDLTGYRFRDDCDTCEAVARIKRARR